MISHDSIRYLYVNSRRRYVNFLVKMRPAPIRCLLINCPKCMQTINLD
jgi:hypothetical protein